jgi:hypothetical protein
MSDMVQRAGLEALAYELDNLRCALAGADRGGAILTVEQARRMEQRVAELEAALDEDDVIAVLAQGDE